MEHTESNILSKVQKHGDKVFEMYESTQKLIDENRLLDVESEEYEVYKDIQKLIDANEWFVITNHLFLSESFIRKYSDKLNCINSIPKSVDTSSKNLFFFNSKA